MNYVDGVLQIGKDYAPNAGVTPVSAKMFDGLDRLPDTIIRSYNTYTFEKMAAGLTFLTISFRVLYWEREGMRFKELWYEEGLRMEAPFSLN